MRLAVYHQLPSGGGKRALYELLKRLRTNHEITLFTHRDCEAYLDLTKLAHKVVWLPALPGHQKDIISKLRVGRQIKQYEVMQSQLAQTIDDGNFDLAFIHPSSYIQSPSVLHYLHTPSLYYSQEIRRVWYEKRIRDQAIGSGPRSLLMKYRVRRLSQLDSRNMLAATRVCVNSFHSAEAHKRAYGRQVEVAYLGINLDEIASSANRPKPTEGTLRLLNVGGLEPFKNQLSLVTAGTSLVEKQIPIELHFVFDRADPMYLQKVKTEIQLRGLVATFHEAISDKKLSQLYAQSDLTVCLADLEPFGLTPLESLAMNTPVVAIKEGGYRETIIDGVNGVFSASLEADQLADAIIQARALKVSLSHLRGYVEKEWNWSDAVERIERTMQDIISGR